MENNDYAIIYDRYASLFRDGSYLFTFDNLLGEYKLYRRIEDKRYRNGCRYDLHFVTRNPMRINCELSVISRLGL